MTVIKRIQRVVASVVVATTAALSCSQASVEAASLTIGQNFTGLTLDKILELKGSEIPVPDSMGAVGSNHFVEFINGAFSIYDKTTGTPVQTISDDQFWTDVADVDFIGGLSDPRILYDPTSQRWFTACIDLDFDTGSNNNLLFAVSKSSDPTAGWKGFVIEPDPTNTLFADFPTLGLDADGVYLSSINYNLNFSATLLDEKSLFDVGLTGTTVISIPKADLLLPSPTVANRTSFYNLPLSELGFVVQPVVDFGPSDGRAALLSVDNDIFGVLNRNDILGADGSEATLSVSNEIPVSTTSIPFRALQPDGTASIDTGKGDFSGNVYELGDSLWAVHSINVNGRAALRWYEIDERTNELLQSGTITDPDHDYYFPSIAVNKFGSVVIGFSRSGMEEFVSSYAVVGATVSGVTTFGSPILLKAGEANFRIYGDTFEPWGDYSATSVDPTEPFSFWTVQEFAGVNNTWGTQITQLKVPPGATSIPEPSPRLGVLVVGLLAACSRLLR